jgi:eukaryotic-like serine/threonine-protein kinase
VTFRTARLAWAVLVMAAVLGAGSIATHVGTQRHTSESGGALHEVFHLATLGPAVAVWLRCRGSLMSVRAIELIDGCLTISACMLYAILGVTASSSLTVAFSVLLAMTYTLVGRSIIVPSSFRRTLWISGVSAIPIVVYFAIQRVSAAFEQSARNGRIFFALGILWCVLAVLEAAANSRQLYGLRAQLREIGKLGQYTLEEKIGEGAMGVVFRATHAMLRRPAAIKLLAKDRTSGKDQARFEREVQLTSRLVHPNTISVFDYGRTADGVFYYVMEYLEGLDLDRSSRNTAPSSRPEPFTFWRRFAGLLARRTRSPSSTATSSRRNIMLTARIDEPDVVRVVDFGLVRTAGIGVDESRTEAVAGTPMYLSPESISRPESVDGRADIYALGAVAYFLLAGRDVFEGNTMVEVLSRHMLEEPRPPSTHLGKALPSDLEAIVLQCLAKDPGARPDSAATLLASLLDCEDAARYDKAAAFAWWRKRAARFRGGPSPVVIGSGATMTVDFRGRDDTAADS